MGNASSSSSKHGAAASNPSTASPPRGTVGVGGSAGNSGTATASSSAGQQQSSSGTGLTGSLAEGAAGVPGIERPKDEGNKELAATLNPQDARVDNGHLLPLSNIYPSSPQDWLHDVVQKLIIDRKLAPFYRGLEDWEEDEYDKEAVNTALDKVGDDQSKAWRSNLYKDSDRRAEAAMYKKTAECPICFLCDFRIPRIRYLICSCNIPHDADTIPHLSIPLVAVINRSVPNALSKSSGPSLLSAT